MPLHRDIRRRKGILYVLHGKDMHPKGREWANAGEALRRLYWTILAKEVAQIKDAELSDGVDWTGKKLKPIRPRTWEERRRQYTVWWGPPLMPQFDLSRTRRLHQVVPIHNGVAGYWTERWGKILTYHSRGDRTKNLPVRDVCGLTERHQRIAVREATSKWLNAVRAMPQGIEDVQLPQLPRAVIKPPPRRVLDPYEALRNELEDLYGIYFERMRDGADDLELRRILERIEALQNRVEVLERQPAFRRRNKRRLDARVKLLIEAPDVRIQRQLPQRVPEGGRRLIASFSID